MKIKLKMKFIFTALITFASLAAYAYIPPYWMIMSRVAENHGKGPYRVSQDVTFYHGAEPLSVHEVWTIAGEDEMRLEVYGKGPLKEQIRLRFVYDKNRRYFLDEKGSRKYVKAPLENPEIFFHFRYSKNIKPHLVALKVTPAESLRSAPFKPTPKTPNYPEENYVRLARSGGVINYALGTPSTNQLLPGIWIEQDQFVIRKIRIRDDLEISASEYKRIKNGLMLPMTRDLLWKSRTVRISVNDADSLIYGKNTKEYLNPQDLLKRDDKDETKFVWPSDSVISEFYTELR
jgi:hypothetical protein